MNGPEHYKEAELLLEAARDDSDDDFSPAGCLKAAQVHATLALAAATAVTQASAYDGDEQNARSRGWSGVV